MTESKSKTPPHFKSLDELVMFFDTHDMGKFWDGMPETHFKVDLKSRTHLLALDAEIANKLTEIAKSKRIPSEALANVWLREKIIDLNA